MLKGTGLTFSFATDHSIVLKQPKCVDFDIPAGSAVDVVIAWGNTAHMLVSYGSIDGSYHLDRFQSPGVHGCLDPLEALERLLTGTGLWYGALERGVWIYPKPKLRSYQWFDRPARKKETPVLSLLPEVMIAANRFFNDPAVTADPTQTYTGTDVRNTGAITVQDFAATIPQVWGGGPNEYSAIGREAATNSTRGTGFNWGGLDARETIVTVDGSRMPGSGTSGEYADISMLPLFAIDSVKIIPDGGSTLVGADAVAGVAEFELRSFDGLETQAHFGGATDGSPMEKEFGAGFGKKWNSGEASVAMEYYERGALSSADRSQATSDVGPGLENLNAPYGYPGNIVVGPQTYAVVSTINGRPVLGPAGSMNTYNHWSNVDIFPWQQRLSAAGHASTKIGDNTEIWTSMWASKRHSAALNGGYGVPLQIPATNPGYLNPTGGSAPIIAQYNFGSIFGPESGDYYETSGNIALGMRDSIGGWQMDAALARAFEADQSAQTNFASPVGVNAALNSTDPGEVFNPYADPAAINSSLLTALRESAEYESHYRLDSARVAADRHFVVLSDRDFHLTLGTEYRRESLNSYPLQLTRQSFEHTIGAGYAQLSVPLVTESNEILGMRSLEATLGERYEHYSDVSGGGMAVPAFKLSWSIVPQASLRGTYTRSFHPPAMFDRSEATNLSGFFRLLSGESALVENGGNSDLKPETGRTWTAGLDVTLVPGFSVSTTYFDIVSAGRVVQPVFSLGLNNFEGVLIPAPTLSQRVAACTHSTFRSGTLATCEQTPVDVLVDARLQNSELLHTTVQNVEATYLKGDWDIRFDGSYIFRYLEKTIGLGQVSLLNTANYPVDFRGRLSVSRTFHNITGTVAANYTAPYHNFIGTEEQAVGSWTTLDAQLRYKIDSLLGGFTFAIGSKNFLNRNPPRFVNAGFLSAWDPANGGNDIGRVIYATATQSW